MLKKRQEFLVSVKNHCSSKAAQSILQTLWLAKQRVSEEELLLSNAAIDSIAKIWAQTKWQMMAMIVKLEIVDDCLRDRGHISQIIGL